MGLEMGKLSVKEIENRWTKGEESMSVGKGGTEDSDGDDGIAVIVLVGVGHTLWAKGVFMWNYSRLQ